MRIGLLQLFQREYLGVGQGLATHAAEDRDGKTTQPLFFFVQIHGQDATFSLKYLQQSEHSPR